MYLIRLFFIYSFLGYLIELINQAIYDQEPGHSGILFGPWCPVYGLGAILIQTIFYMIEQLSLPIILSYICMTITAFILLSTIELIGGILIEKCFKIVFWDYSKQPYSLGKYVSLKMSTIWSMGSIILYKFFFPLTNKIYLPDLFIYIFILLIILDTIISFIILSKKKK